MSRYLERSDSVARLIEAGFRIALTRNDAADEEWASVLLAAGSRDSYFEHYDDLRDADIVDFMLRDRDNPGSVLCMMEAARTNARAVRTALTREVWEALNEAWMSISDTLKNKVKTRDLPDILARIKRQNAQVTGAIHSTMLRNDIFSFAGLGTKLERANSTARILDVKYYVLLPSVSMVGSSLDNVQWETILRAVSAHRSYHWLMKGDASPASIAEFLILDRRMPRSLIFSYDAITQHLGRLAQEYDAKTEAHLEAWSMLSELMDKTIEDIFDEGLHEFLSREIGKISKLSGIIERSYRFDE